MIFSDTLTGTRYAAETRGSDGRAVAGATTALTGIAASVQRPDPEILARLLEGGHTMDAWFVDTRTALRTLDELNGTPADEVVIDGLTYVVFKVTHVRAVIPHYECLVLRQATGRQP
jgi:hypothetical protein